MSNYSILQQNILDSLETDDGCAAFLWASSLPDADRYQYRAEAFARTVDRLAQEVWQCLSMAELNVVPELSSMATVQWNEDTKADLFRYMMDRHAFHVFPGRKTGWTRLLHPTHAEAA